MGGPRPQTRTQLCQRCGNQLFGNTAEVDNVALHTRASDRSQGIPPNDRSVSAILTAIQSRVLSWLTITTANARGASVTTTVRELEHRTQEDVTADPEETVMRVTEHLLANRKIGRGPNVFGRITQTLQPPLPRIITTRRRYQGVSRGTLRGPNRGLDWSTTGNGSTRRGRSPSISHQSRRPEGSHKMTRGAHG